MGGNLFIDGLGAGIDCILHQAGETVPVKHFPASGFDFGPSLDQGFGKLGIEALHFYRDAFRQVDSAIEPHVPDFGNGKGMAFGRRLPFDDKGVRPAAPPAAVQSVVRSPLRKLGSPPDPQEATEATIRFPIGISPQRRHGQFKDARYSSLCLGGNRRPVLLRGCRQHIQNVGRGHLLDRQHADLGENDVG